MRRLVVGPDEGAVEGGGFGFEERRGIEGGDVGIPGVSAGHGGGEVAEEGRVVEEAGQAVEFAEGAAPFDGLGGSLDEEDEGDVKRVVHQDPELLADGAKVVFGEVVEVEHVEEVEKEDGGDNDAAEGARDVALVAFDVETERALDAGGQADDAFADDDQCEETHAFDNVRALEAQGPPFDRRENGDPDFKAADDVPERIDLVSARGCKGWKCKRETEKHDGGERQCGHDNTKRNSSGMIVPGK